MFSPMFDGQYRSKPQVSLRGASKKVCVSVLLFITDLNVLSASLYRQLPQEDKRNLLKRAQDEREQREVRSGVLIFYWK